MRRTRQEPANAGLQVSRSQNLTCRKLHVLPSRESPSALAPSSLLLRCEAGARIVIRTSDDFCNRSANCAKRKKEKKKRRKSNMSGRAKPPKLAIRALYSFRHRCQAHHYRCFISILDRSWHEMSVWKTFGTSCRLQGRSHQGHIRDRKMVFVPTPYTFLARTVEPWKRKVDLRPIRRKTLKKIEIINNSNFHKNAVEKRMSFAFEFQHVMKGQENQTRF